MAYTSNDLMRARLILRSTTLLNLVLPVLTMSITFAFYTLVQKEELTASKGRPHTTDVALD